MGSIIASEKLVNKTTIRRPSKSDTFKGLHQTLELFSLLPHTRNKFQEALDKDEFAALTKN